MLRKTMLAMAMLALLGLAAAQITIEPTTTADHDVFMKDSQVASVAQTVLLELPEATALHLATPTILFDLNALDGEGWEARAVSGQVPADFGYACVYVSGPDVADDLSSVYWGQEQVIPGGIAYGAAPTAEEWAQIKLIYIGNGMTNYSNVPDTERVATYPPIRIDATTGKLVEGSKEYFVCYQTFVIQLFSNWDFYRLQVSRADAAGVESIQHLYVQGNSCADFGDGTGLYDLPNGATRYLLPTTMIAGPTGSHVDDGTLNYCNPNSSWLDVLGVLAIKVNADHYGTSTANLTYTLLSSDSTTFTFPPSDPPSE